MRYNARIISTCLVVASVVTSTLALPLSDVEECSAETQVISKRDADAQLDLPQAVLDYSEDVATSSPESHEIQKRGLEKRTLWSLAQRILGKACSTKSAKQEADLMNASIQSNNGVSQQGSIAPENEVPASMASSYEVIEEVPGNNVPVNNAPAMDLSQSMVNGGGNSQPARLVQRPVYPLQRQSLEPIQEIPKAEDRESDIDSVTGSLRESLSGNHLYPSQQAREFYKDPSLWGSQNSIQDEAQADNGNKLGTSVIQPQISLPDDDPFDIVDEDLPSKFKKATGLTGTYFFNVNVSDVLLNQRFEGNRRGTMMGRRGGDRRHHDGPPKKPGIISRFWNGKPKEQMNSGGMNYNVPQYRPVPEIIDNPNWLVNPADRLYELEQNRRAQAKLEAELRELQAQEDLRKQDLYDEMYPEGEAVNPMAMSQALGAQNTPVSQSIVDPMALSQTLNANTPLSQSSGINPMAVSQPLKVPTTPLSGSGAIDPMALSQALGPNTPISQSSGNLDPLAVAQIRSPAENGPTGQIITEEESSILQESVDPLNQATIFNPVDQAAVFGVPAGRIDPQNDILYPNPGPGQSEKAPTEYQSFGDPSFQDDIYSIKDANETGDFGGNVMDQSGNLGVSQIIPADLRQPVVQQQITDVVAEDDAEYNSDGSRDPDEYDVDLLQSDVVPAGANSMGFSFANPGRGGGQ
ncbi:hypothetical protein TWF694_006913 [Orbilia ellipsospora]|uniref:Secreted protein n=1 Tax=Orbilia ellipsospora TaxID=2528407 RepID=A0AAV9XN09_9PEZI